MQKDILIQYIGKDKKYNVFEEGVDQEVMDQFHKFKDILTDDDLRTDNPEDDIRELFEEGLPFDYQKLLLVRLSQIEYIKAYRALQAFAEKSQGDVKKWAVIACQQSRAIIEGALIDEDKVFIISGLGGKADKLRYFAVMTTPDSEIITGNQADIIRKELQYSADTGGGIIEDIKVKNDFVTATCLLPIDKSVGNFFKNTVDNINELGNFLSEIVFVTNTKKFSDEEIKAYIKEGPNALFDDESMSQFLYDSDFYGDEYDDFDIGDDDDPFEGGEDFFDDDDDDDDDL